MRLISLKLENIRSYPSAYLEFPTGIVMLSGDIGSGKSTVLLAIEFALFGLLRGEVSGNALLRNGSLRGSVELVFQINEHNYTIKRLLKRSKDSVEQEAGFVVIDGIKIAGTPIELKSRVLDVLGYPPEQLTKAKNLIYRYTLYTPQEEMKHILQESADERLALLRKIFDIDKYSIISQNANGYAKALRERKRALEAVISDLEEKKQFAEKLELEKSSAKKSKEDYEAKLLSIREQLSSAKDKLSEAEKNRVEFENLRNLLSAFKAKIGAQEMQLNAQLGELIMLDKQEIELSNNSIIKAPEQPSDEIIKDIQSKESDIISKTAVVSKHSTIKIQAKNAIDKFCKFATCPTCLQEVPEAHKSSILLQQQKIINEAETEELKIKAGLQTIEQEINILRKKAEEIRKQEQEFELGKLKVSQLQTLSQRKNSLQAYKSALEQEIALQKTSVKDIEAKLQNFDDSEYNNTRKEVDRLLQDERNLSVQHSALAQKEEQISKQLVTIQEDVARKERNKQSLERTQHIHQWIVDYFVPLMEVIEKQVMARIHHEFDALFQQWFSMLVEDLMTARLDASFTPLIQQDGYDIDVANLSGGERTACALAYRLSLNRTINSIISGIQTKDLLILDEPTDGFSSEQLDKMRDVISQLNLSQIIIVSHEQKIEGFANKVIRLEKTQNGTVLL